MSQKISLKKRLLRYCSALPADAVTKHHDRPQRCPDQIKFKQISKGSLTKGLFLLLVSAGTVNFSAAVRVENYSNTELIEVYN